MSLVGGGCPSLCAGSADYSSSSMLVPGMIQQQQYCARIITCDPPPFRSIADSLPARHADESSAHYPPFPSNPAACFTLRESAALSLFTRATEVKHPVHIGTSQRLYLFFHGTVCRHPSLQAWCAGSRTQPSSCHCPHRMTAAWCSRDGQIVVVDDVHHARLGLLGAEFGLPAAIVHAE